MAALGAVRRFWCLQQVLASAAAKCSLGLLWRLGRAFVLLEITILRCPQPILVISCLLLLFSPFSSPIWKVSVLVEHDSFIYLCFGTNKNFQCSSPEPMAARQNGAAPGRGWVCDGASGILEFGYFSLLVLNLLHIHQASFAFSMSPWPFDAKPLHTPWPVQGHLLQLIPCEGSGKVNRTVYPLFAQFFTSSCLSCSYPATQPMGEKKNTTGFLAILVWMFWKTGIMSHWS